MLGSLSEKYESNGYVGSVSDGIDDPGGKSYGIYQLASNTGSVEDFMNWAAESENPSYQQYGEELRKNDIASEEFDDKWKEIADKDENGFFAMQHDYIQYAYYEPAVAALKEAGFDADKHSDAMKDVIWSRSVQYGTGHIVEMFETACQRMYNKNNNDHSGYPNLSYVDNAAFDYDMIVSIYSYVCHTAEWTAASCRYGLYNRFEAEQADALEMLMNE